MNPAFPRRKPRAFTLLELLVCVAVFGVLAALLIGGVGTAREKAKGALCAGNLRQCGVALRLYANENQGRFPAALERDGFSWASALAAQGYIPPLVEGQKTVATCPSSASQGRYADFRRVYGMWMGHANYGEFQFSRDGACFRLSPLKLEANRILVADSGRCLYGEAWDPSYFIMSGTGKEETTPAHKVINLIHHAKANALFVDGHIEQVDAAWLKNDGRYNWTISHK